ncbi:Superfamily II DNA/RNA helicase [Ignavibacterium album JCM 16511]|uniref:Superfamily II DNA/RNA helicase n=1 Tax=Ignavibacterium album (strain DSM 19864 / JCM 16511 / NBRC 101810 / Mat9-16) TaxID=945713 RepID=I0AKS4_IGNAJ|nr:Superfamily II DNA/RNA helicase [Ignavibacterium album]AFH49581.1 Superfamily II DNA/RNA helicase [Ignavibacterium album JCM 16511]
MVVRQARKKLATSISKIEVRDEFQFNKWLRPAVNKKIEIPKVRTFEDPYLVEFDRLRPPLAVKFKFNFSQPELPSVKFPEFNQKARSYMVFFTIPKQRVINKSDIFVCNKKAEVRSVEFNLKTTVINKSKIYIPEAPKIIQKSFAIIAPLLKEMPMLIRQPLIKDYLSEMIPEIIKIDLLDEQSVSFDIDQKNVWQKFEVDKIKTPKIYKIKIPGVENIFNTITSTRIIPIIDLEITQIYDFKTSIDSIPKISKAKFELNKTSAQKINFSQYETKAEVIDVLGSEHSSLSDKIKHILSPIVDLKWEDVVNQLNFLKDHEIEGAKFLTEHNFAILADELGIDKKTQLLAAAKFLLRTGNINSVLCITLDKKLYDSSISKKFDYDFAWESILQKKFHDLHYTIISTEKENIERQTHLTFLPINKLNTDSFELLKKLRRFDLVILDDLITGFTSKEIIDQIIKKIEPEYFWITSDIVNEGINETLINEFDFGSKVEFSYLARNLESIKTDSETLRKEVWFELDEMQVFEYEEAVNSAKDELIKTFETMNPFKFQSNIFTLIHKLKQILNFSSFRNISPKATHLIEQLVSVSRNRRKALIFTQYDENGLKKIDQVLTNNDLKFVLIKNGATIEEIKKSVEDFYNRKEICALVTNLKPSKLSIDLSKISYIINFDQWWNPVINWQNETDLKLDNSRNNKIVIFDYYIKNTFEEDLKFFLQTKGLLHKDVFEFVKNEVIADMIPASQWLKFFGHSVNDDESAKELYEELVAFIEQTDLSKFKEMVQLVLNSIGFKEIEIMDIKQEPSFYITGFAKKGRSKFELQAKGIMSDKVTLADYEEMLTTQNKEKNSKRLLFANCEIEKIETNRITFIDKYLLANYIQLLGYIYKFLTKRTSVSKSI